MRRLFFLGYLLLALLASTGLTYWLANHGIDWKLANFYNRNEVFVWMAVPCVLAGMVVPLIIIGYYFREQYKLGSNDGRIQAKRALFSFVWTYLTMTILKVFTNRIDMEPFEPLGTIDTSTHFRFGFLNSNSWWESFSEGWPSGHTMIAVGMAIAIHPLIRSEFWKKINVLYPILVAWSVSTAFHWLSDVLAGALIGAVIGWYFSRFPMKSLRD